MLVCGVNVKGHGNLKVSITVRQDSIIHLESKSPVHQD